MGGNSGTQQGQESGLIFQHTQNPISPSAIMHMQMGKNLPEKTYDR
jgi:hypothetical protein